MNTRRRFGTEQKAIFAARDRKLAEARERRKEQREAARLQAVA